MRLVYPPYDINMEIQENQVNVLSVENTSAYSAILKDFWFQTQGLDGNFVMSEGEKTYELVKVAACIFNPFDINCNDKKIINKLYQELKEYALDNLVEDNAKINEVMLQHLDRILQGVPYALDYTVDFDVTNLLKAYNVCVQTVGDTLLENILEYLRVMKQICKVSYFVIVGLKYYLNEFELKQLYEFLFYEKINVIIVEAMHSQTLDNEKCWILDKDLCLISPI